MLWLVVAYLGSLAVMFISALWTTDSFTGNVVKTINGQNLQDVYTDAVYRRVALRTVGVAAGVTLIDAIIAFPVAFYMSKVASRRTRLFMVVAIVTPAYLWLPYMVLPVFAGFEQLPASLLEASSDLGGRPGRTIRSVVLPMVFPAIAAGSIFTFSLSLGDYIAVGIVGGKTQLLANVIYG